MDIKVGVRSHLPKQQDRGFLLYWSTKKFPRWLQGPNPRYPLGVFCRVYQKLLQWCEKERRRLRIGELAFSLFLQHTPAQRALPHPELALMSAETPRAEGSSHLSNFPALPWLPHPYLAQLKPPQRTPHPTSPLELVGS